MRARILIIFFFLLPTAPSETNPRKTATHNLIFYRRDFQADEPSKIIRCGAILIRGCEQLTNPELCHFLEGASDNPLDSNFSTLAATGLINEYRRRGFLDASLSWKGVERQAASSTSAMTLKIQEGPIYRLRRLEMVGNRTTHDKVIRRRVAIEEGTPFDEELLELSIRRINRLGIFEEFTRGDVDVAVNRKEHFVDLTFNLREK